MKASIDEMKTVLETGKFIVREAEWGNMHAGFETYIKKIDLGPLLKGLPNNMCQCPHWGYVIKGVYRVKFSDGHEEVYKPGDAYYMQPGHAPIMDAGSEIIEFSPMKELAKTMKVAEKNLNKLGIA